MAGQPGVPAQAQFMVAVPQGIAPGQALVVTSPDGQQLQVAVPLGCGPGSQFPVLYTPVTRAHAQQVMAPVAPMAYMQPQQQMMGGGGINYMGFTPGQPLDPYGLLGQVGSIKITQQIQWAEVLIGFDMPNKYLISDVATGKDLFIAAERNDGLMGVVGRQVLEGSQRPFNLDIALLTGPGLEPLPFLRLERPFKCTCCCFQRPAMSIHNTLTGQPIGTTVEPFSCCHFRLGIQDPAKNDVLNINHHCCDCSLLCWGCPCGCQETDFQVKDNDRTVGHVRRQFNTAQAIGMMTGINADSDQFTVDFSEVQDPEWKATLIATAIFLDYCYFTKGGQKGRQESALGRASQNNRQVDRALGPMAGFFDNR